ncbi:PEP-CTERM sorting domain-containing protein [Akkermansiaceae bacterium]|nr:PEP-CTERM sorting domain-containing protein [Akkermansiaceae bacterium]
MKLTHLLSISLFAGAALTSQAAVVWTGGAATDDFYDAANWDFSASSSTVVTSPTDDDITITGATINEPSAAFSNLPIGDTLSVTLDGTSFTFTNSNGFTGVNDAGDVTSTVNMLGGSSMSAQFASVGITVNVDGTSSLTFRGGGDAINSQTEKTTINLSLGAQLTLPTVAEFTEQGADIVVNGVSFADDTSILSFSGNTATAVPEPTSALLSSLAALGLLRRRR